MIADIAYAVNLLKFSLFISNTTDNICIIKLKILLIINLINLLKVIFCLKLNKELRIYAIIASFIINEYA